MVLPCLHTVIKSSQVASALKYGVLRAEQRVKCYRVQSNYECNSLAAEGVLIL